MVLQPHRHHRRLGTTTSTSRNSSSRDSLESQVPNLGELLDDTPSGGCHSALTMLTEPLKRLQSNGSTNTPPPCSPWAQSDGSSRWTCSPLPATSASKWQRDRQSSCSWQRSLPWSSRRSRTPCSDKCSSDCQSRPQGTSDSRAPEAVLKSHESHRLSVLRMLVHQSGMVMHPVLSKGMFSQNL